jgi:heme A synthase
MLQLAHALPLPLVLAHGAIATLLLLALLRLQHALRAPQASR